MNRCVGSVSRSGGGQGVRRRLQRGGTGQCDQGAQQRSHETPMSWGVARLQRLAAVRRCPTQFRELIEGKEYRVTVLGRRIWARPVLPALGPPQHAGALPPAHKVRRCARFVDQRLVPRGFDLILLVPGAESEPARRPPRGRGDPVLSYVMSAGHLSRKFQAAHGESQYSCGTRRAYRDLMNRSLSNWPVQTAASPRHPLRVDSAIKGHRPARLPNSGPTAASRASLRGRR